MEIRVASDLQPDSIVDGEGIRTVLWTQGCGHHCKGCHNPETWSFDAGINVDVELVKKELSKIKGQDGITLSGGDPWFQIDACLEIAKYCHELGWNVWCYTGFTWEQIMIMSKGNPNACAFLQEIDVLVDGRFRLEERSLDLKYKGSKNQRIIDVQKSLESGSVVEIEKYQGQKEIGSIYHKPEHIYI